MPVSNVLIRKIGEQLLDWVYLGVRTGMRRGVEDYRRYVAAGRLLEAEAQIKRAVDLPHRARARINYAITLYGQPALAAAVNAANPNVTVAEVSAELTSLEAYAQTLVDHRLIDGWTWDQIATDIETNIERELSKWQFPFPPGYLDVWGE